jgi:hypothetical protein
MAIDLEEIEIVIDQQDERSGFRHLWLRTLDQTSFRRAGRHGGSPHARSRRSIRHWRVLPRPRQPANAAGADKVRKHR